MLSNPILHFFLEMPLFTKKLVTCEVKVGLVAFQYCNLSCSKNSFQEKEEQLERIRLEKEEEERRIQEEMKRQQEEIMKQQEELRRQKEEMERQKMEIEKQRQLELQVRNMKFGNEW